jgi:hypothetical protein
MGKNIRQRLLLRFFIVFIIVTAIAMVLAQWLDANKINHYVVMGANTLLLILAGIATFMHIKAAANPNPNVFVRSVMGATLLKLMVIVIVLAVYLFTAGQNKSIYAVFAGMGLYIVYTVIEVRGLTELNKQKNGSN